VHPPPHTHVRTTNWEPNTQRKVLNAHYL